ncbi:MAG: Rpn family recombination-promoting nuclease/putative transposase [bacterium]
MQFADPRTDFAFKKIFGNEQAKDVLISFLNAVLGLDPSHAIADVVILNPYQAPKTKFMHKSYVDVKCLDVSGVSYIVEMQVAYVAGFEKRAIYNASKTYSNQMLVGEAYPKLNQVISINILDFILFDDFKHYLSCHQIKEQITGNCYLDEIRYYFIELPKFAKAEDELETVIEKWIYFIKHTGHLDHVPAKLDAPAFRKAFELANRANMTPLELENYEGSIMAMLDERGRIDGAFEKGERNKARIIARAMRQEKMAEELIVKVTGLRVEEIEKL